MGLPHLKRRGDHHCKGKHPFPFRLVSNPSVPDSFFTTRTADYRPASVPPSLLVLPTPPFTDLRSRFNELALPPRLLPLRLGHPVSTPPSLSYKLFQSLRDNVYLY